MTAFLSESIPTSCLSGRDRAPWTPSQSVIPPWQLQSFAGPVQVVATTVLCVLCCVQWLCCGPEEHFTVLCLLALALGSLSWCSWAWRDMRSTITCSQHLEHSVDVWIATRRLKCQHWVFDPPVCISVPRRLGLHVCTTTPGLCLI